MRLHPRLALAFATLCMVAGTTEAQADTISQWNFGTVEAAPYNSPAPDVGTGVATVLGMDNSYIFSSGNTITGSGTFTYTTLYSIGSVAYADILATPGDPNGFANAWRIRGPSNNPGEPPDMGNCWALQAPQYTQGAAVLFQHRWLHQCQFSFRLVHHDPGREQPARAIYAERARPGSTSTAR